MSAGSTTNTTCYNTITTNTNVVAVPTTNVRPLRPPSLPDGQIIDGKNTLQSFIASPTSERLTSNKMLYSNVANENDPVVNINGVNGMTTGFTPNMMATRTTTGTTNDDTPIHAEAIPVRSLAVVVDAEIADVGPPPWNVNGKDEHHHHHAKPRSVLFWLLNLLAMMLVGAVVGVSVYCGTGNCGTRSSTGRSISRSSPTPTPTVKVTPPPNVPIAAVVTNVPVVPPIIAVESSFSSPSLEVACNFTFLPNLTECQSTTSISIRHKEVVGNTIPSELGLLTQLTSLTFFNNQLIGRIPSTLGNLVRLTRSSLHTNQLTGTIPSTLGNLRQLNALYLSDNQLNGTIPVNLGNLTKLNVLNLEGNELRGAIPSILGNLVHLTDLSLNGNVQLTGNIPSTLGQLIRINILNLSENRLNGTIPHTLGNLTQLNVLSLNNNQLSGVIPSPFGNLKELTNLSLSMNRLNGTIPSLLGNLIQLESLRLDNNQLTGTIPSTFGNLKQLEYLSMANNQLNGTIPSTLGNLVRLRYFVLSNNTQLNGTTIPPTLCLTTVIIDINSTCDNDIGTEIIRTNGTAT